LQNKYVTSGSEEEPLLGCRQPKSERWEQRCTFPRPAIDLRDCEPRSYGSRKSRDIPRLAHATALPSSTRRERTADEMRETAEEKRNKTVS
jgi:hypothetical protein